MTTSRRLAPLFVVGCPRSGTTMIGHYLETSPAVVHLGEYGALYVTWSVLPHFGIAGKLSGRPPSPHVERYREEARRHAQEFPSRIDAPHARYWCDSSPVNLLIAGELVEWLPDARYVLVVRHYRGVLPSLARCFERGEMWAGATWHQRAALWSQYYTQAGLLPVDRVTVVSYDRLCAEPFATLAELQQRLGSIGIPAESLDAAALATSWATVPEERRPTVGAIAGDGSARLAPVEAPRPPWTSEDEARIAAIAAPARARLVETFPELAGWV